MLFSYFKNDRSHVWPLTTSRVSVFKERRILCVAWSPDGTHLAAGSVNAVCLHQARTGAQVSRITVGRQVGRKETLVWSVALLADLTIVTGDSR